MSGKTIASRATKALATIEESLGGREALIEALQYADLSADELCVIEKIADPINDRRALHTICAEEGISVGKFLQIFQQATIARAVLNALVAQADRIGDVVEDVVDRALPLDVKCPTCHGVEKKKPCTRCGGTGSVTKPPSITRQKLALDLYRMLQKTGPSIVAINQNAGDPNRVDRMLRTTMEATDKILYSRDHTGEDVSEPIDVEVQEIQEAKKEPKVQSSEPLDVIDSPFVIPTPAGSKPKEEDVPP
jgi:hypothetical protein